MRVLYVEDEPGAAALARDRMAARAPGVLLEAAAGPGEAARLLAARPYDAVLTPLRPGDGDGFDLLHWIRMRALPTAVVALTAEDDRDSALAALRAGADACVDADNGRLERLLPALEAAVRRNRAGPARRPRPLRVLHAGSAPEDARPLRLHLERHAPHLLLVTAADGPDARRLLDEGGWDAVLLDDRLEGVPAVDLLRGLTRGGESPLPVVLVAGEGGEMAALQAMRLGADAAVVRSPGWLHRVPAELEGAFARCELQRGEAAVRARERMLQSVFDSLPARVLVLDRHGVVTYASRSWLEMAGECHTPVCTAGLGESYLEACRGAVPDADAARAVDGITRVLDGGAERFEMEYACHALEGEQWYLMQAASMPAEHGGAVVCHVNVTERRRMEDALRESHERYALATAAGAVGLWDWDLESGEMFVDPALKALLGYADADIRNHIDDWGRHVHPDDVGKVAEEVAAHLEGRAPRFHVEHRMVHRDGSVRWFLARGAAERRPDGTAYRMLGTDTDITERKHVEEALRSSKAELSRLAGRLIVAQEDERGRIARELHDDVSQQVAVLGIGISRVIQSLQHTHAESERLHAQVSDVAERVRALSHRMHPAVLEHAGLVPALRSFCDEFGKMTGIETEFRARRTEGPLAADLALAAFRVAQEGMRNAARHSGADRVQVTLSREAGTLELVVSDSGAGFDPAAVGADGLGLMSMAERVRLMGGRFEVESAPGQGTLLRARFPLPPPEGERGTDPARLLLSPPA